MQNYNYYNDKKDRGIKKIKESVRDREWRDGGLRERRKNIVGLIQGCLRDVRFSTSNILYSTCVLLLLLR